MSLLVRVKHGSYRGEDITNETFPLLKEYTVGKKGGFVTVNGTSHGRDSMRIKVKANGFEILGAGTVDVAGEVIPEIVETDDQVMERITERFEILDKMTAAVIAGQVKSVIFTGPPGVGKSYGVTEEIDRFNMFDTLSGQDARAVFVKGSMTPIGLYKMLYKYSGEGQVIIFDDCDKILYEDDSLNLLKAALDSSKVRRICWHAESRVLKEEGLPTAFNFKGGVIFISNLKFESNSKKLGAHLEALRSRCHYVDLTLDTMRDKFLRIKQIFRTGELFKDYGFTGTQEQAILDYMEKNQDIIHEMSLRTAVKIADLVRVDATNWPRIAKQTILRNK